MIIRYSIWLPHQIVNWGKCARKKHFKRYWNRSDICEIANRNIGVSHTAGITHYNDVIMGAIESQITSLTSVFSTVYSDADQRKHQSSAPLAFVRGIHRGQVNSPHKWPVTRKMFPVDDVIMSLLITFDLYTCWCSSATGCCVCNREDRDGGGGGRREMVGEKGVTIHYILCCAAIDARCFVAVWWCILINGHDDSYDNTKKYLFLSFWNLEQNTFLSLTATWF